MVTANLPNTGNYGNQIDSYSHGLASEGPRPSQAFTTIPIYLV